MGLEIAAQIAASLAESKYAAGVMMILLNIGTSFLMQDLMPLANRVFQHRWARRVVFFVIFFTATRDAVASLVLTLACTLLLDFFLNDRSRYCIIPFSCRTLTSDPLRREGFAAAGAGASSGGSGEGSGGSGGSGGGAPLSRQQRVLLNAHLLERRERAEGRG